ncbi:Bax inhibitor-1/YccA family protein [Permianibacter sp. IMCC34836]|nr:Bax inhibitor-1/YccA family protein [Permianibacter fluminis]
MRNINAASYIGADAQAESTSKVLKNTYMLLSATLLFSAVMAYVGMLFAPTSSPLITFIGAIALLFGVHKTAESGTGLLLVFAFTGWMGFWLAPLLNFMMAKASGGQIVLQALGGTGLIFLSLSAYVLNTKKDFSFMRGFLFVGLMVVFFSSLALLAASYFGVYMPMLSLALSAACVLLFSAFILYDTSNIINGGETNYIRATVALYLDIYNIFTHLLVLLGVASDD